MKLNSSGLRSPSPDLTPYRRILHEAKRLTLIFVQDKPFTAEQNALSISF